MDLVDQNRINVYADVIEDHQFIHVDPSAQEGNRVRTTVAPVFDDVLMSIMSYEVMPVIEGTTMGVITASINCLPSRRCARLPSPAGRFTLMEAKLRQAERAAIAHQRHRRDRGEEKPAWSPTGSG